MSNRLIIANDEIRVTRPSPLGTHVVTAVGERAEKKLRLRVGEKLRSSDLDDFADMGYFIKEQH